MTFSSEPTANADDAAAYMREWYEANRETWLERKFRHPGEADNFMLALMDEARRIQAAADAARRPGTGVADGE